MNKIEAKILLKNLLARISHDADGAMQLGGRFTEDELNAIQFAIESLDDQPPVQTVAAEPIVDIEEEPEQSSSATTEDIQVGTEESDVPIEVDTSVLDLGESPQGMRLCLDFGTAMSKATLIEDDDGQGEEEIHVLELGEQGEGEWADHPFMLTSAIYIDNDGVMWFGQEAIERSLSEAEPGERQVIDSVKRSISESGLDKVLSSIHNPTSLHVTYADMVLANLMFLTWSVNKCLKKLGFERNIMRRFAMPCLEGEKEKEAIHRLGEMLGQAQVLADTFYSALPEGIPLKKFMDYVKVLRRESYDYGFIGEDLTEPLGVAVSRMTLTKGFRTQFLVVDVGAGTIDFGLFKLAYNSETGKGAAVEAKGSDEYLPRAGNHLDRLLLHFVLRKGGIKSDHPMYRNILGALSLQIRSLKETLFSDGYVPVNLFNGELVEVELAEFLEIEQVLQFSAELKEKVVEIFESVDRSFIRSTDQGRIGVILTGGGAQLPMIKALAKGTISTSKGSVELVEAKQFPDWLEEEYIDLEQDYPRIAVSLGGARKLMVKSTGIAKVTAGDIKGKPVIGGYFTKGI